MSAAAAAPTLAGRTAVVTGASSGIGAATARALLDQGARVALLGRRRDRLEQVAGDDPRALVVTADVLDGLQLADALDAVHERFGPVDTVVAAAGLMTAAPFEDGIPGEWGRVVDVNLTGMLTTAQTFVRDLVETATGDRASDLFLVGSALPGAGTPQFAVQSAVEAAVTQLSRSLRAEYGARGVRVHTVEPGLTESEIAKGISDPVSQRSFLAYRAQVTPLQPEDVARSVVFAAQQPAGVNLASVVVLPTAAASVPILHRPLEAS